MRLWFSRWIRTTLTLLLLFGTLASFFLLGYYTLNMSASGRITLSILFLLVGGLMLARGVFYINKHMPQYGTPILAYLVSTLHSQLDMSAFIGWLCSVRANKRICVFMRVCVCVCVCDSSLYMSVNPFIVLVPALPRCLCMCICLTRIDSFQLRRDMLLKLHAVCVFSHVCSTQVFLLIRIPHYVLLREPSTISNLRKSCIMHLWFAFVDWVRADGEFLDFFLNKHMFVVRKTVEFAMA
jgi:hypothetical protein